MSSPVRDTGASIKYRIDVRRIRQRQLSFSTGREMSQNNPKGYQGVKVEYRSGENGQGVLLLIVPLESQPGCRHSVKGVKK